MKLTETAGVIDAVSLPLAAPAIARAEVEPERERLVSLDVMRGFAVLGMIVVNTLASCRDSYGFNPSFGFFAHSRWAGFTFADFVFPAFVFMCGFSVAVSLRHRAPDWQILRRIGSRTIALLILGFLLTNIVWFGNMDHGSWRLMGVLQRIGICYFVTAILFLACRPRMRIAVSLVILLLYWPLALIPASGHPNLFVPGANFISFIDRTVLGPHTLFAGAAGFDPEGLLSTLPAIAQCMLGAAAGEWLLKNRATDSAPLKLAAAGAVSLCAGLAWSPFFPTVKNIWTSSYVLVSTGLALLLLSLSFWALDRQRFAPRGIGFLQAFGANALLAYVVQQTAQLLPAGDDLHALGAASQHTELSAAVANLPVVIFIVMLWLPLEFMRRRRWIVRL
jgi:predicted acyltransferase